MTIYSSKAYIVNIYIGACIGYTSEEYTEEDLYKSISHFQNEFYAEFVSSVVVGKINFIYKSYTEKGFKISVSQYPTNYKPESFIDTFALMLAKFLQKSYNQKKITIESSKEVITIEE